MSGYSVTRLLSSRPVNVAAAAACLTVATSCGGTIPLGEGAGAGEGSRAPVGVQSGAPGSAQAELATLAVKGRAPMTGYKREQFGPAWSDTDHNGCDTRNDVLHRDLTHITLRAGTKNCVVQSGDLADPYTAKTIHFARGGASEVDIDHVVALGDAWQTGAQQWPAGKRLALANDPLNLLSAEARSNRQKGDADAASWLPANKAFRCTYVARQVAVKAKYGLWVTDAERQALAGVLAACPQEKAPSGGNPTIASSAAPAR